MLCVQQRILRLDEKSMADEMIIMSSAGWGMQAGHGMYDPPGSTSLAPNIGAPNARAHEFAWNCTSSHTSASIRHALQDRPK